MTEIGEVGVGKRRAAKRSNRPGSFDKGLASDRVVIDTVVSKYVDHVPLYRQSAILQRETGIELSRATLDGWLMRVGEL